MGGSFYSSARDFCRFLQIFRRFLQTFADFSARFATKIQIFGFALAHTALGALAACGPNATNMMLQPREQAVARRLAERPGANLPTE